MHICILRVCESEKWLFVFYFPVKCLLKHDLSHEEHKCCLGKTAQLLNHLLCKYEDLRMMGISIIHIKTWEFQHTPATPAPWSGNRKIPGACGPASPGNQRAPASVWDLGLENNVESNRRKKSDVDFWLLQEHTCIIQTDTHVHTHTHMSTHVHTHARTCTHTCTHRGMHPRTHNVSYKGVWEWRNRCSQALPSLSPYDFLHKESNF